ncbi:MAG TPA: hypothetical protein VK478_12870 [Gemmatimonadaceae bacterium]|nr:hypothetical protein [Gemmatimonadaceae bacterium]
MRLVRNMLVLILCAGACHPDVYPNRSLTDPAMRKKNSTLKEGATPFFERGGLKFFRLEDVEPEVLLAAQKQAESPEFMAKVAKDSSRGPLRYALADDALPQGADAVVLRDGKGADDRIIVASRSTASDRVLSIARFALFQDEDADPNLRGQKTILIWDDGRIAVNNKLKKISAFFSAPTGDAKALLNQPGEITHLKGIGKVRTFRGQ